MHAQIEKFSDDKPRYYSYNYRDQFDPKKFQVILDAYLKFLPLLFKKLEVQATDIRLVARGMSGTVFVLPIAAKLGCHVTIVRKPEENSHGQKIEGMTHQGLPWIFIDDCIDSGATFRACEEAVGHPPIARVFWGFSWCALRDKMDFRLVDHVNL